MHIGFCEFCFKDNVALKHQEIRLPASFDLVTWVTKPTNSLYKIIYPPSFFSKYI